MEPEKQIAVVYRRVGELTPYENNPRCNEAAVEAVAESIRTCGFLVPIVLDKDGVIAAGDTRLKAAKLLGLEEVPCISAGHLTEEQITYFRLADNRSAEFATWDIAKEAEELAKIVHLDLSVFQFPDFSMDLDVNDEDFLEDANASRRKRKKVVTCPSCGHEFEL